MESRSNVLRAINPATGELVHEYPEHDDAEVEQRLAGARQGFKRWRDLPVEKRAQHMRQFAHELRAAKESLARLIVREMGKPITAARSEIEKSAACCEYFADHGPAMIAPQTRKSDADESYIRFDPMGPILAIMPWNFPVWQVVRFAAPNLMAGNVGVLKHAPSMPGTALTIEQLFAKAGFPAGVFTTLLLRNERARDVIEHPAIAGVTFTGSVKAGGIVASQAGAVRKKTVLELGGSDPFIVLADADIPTTAKLAAQARCINSGQSCIAAKRFIVDAPVAEAFTAAFVAAMRAMKVGDPMRDETQVGPLAREDLRQTLERQVQQTLDSGAKLLYGGERIEGPGFYYLPTVIAGVRPGMAAFDEETFGPVAAVTVAEDADHAIELANRSSYGLGSSIWTRNIDRAREMAGRIQAGCVFINELVQSDPRLPFGGIKDSGYGRELSELAMYEFVNVKSVVLRRSPTPR